MMASIRRCMTKAIIPEARAPPAEESEESRDEEPEEVPGHGGSSFDDDAWKFYRGL
jgi:hypothetical protein